MAQAARLASRLQRELKMLQSDPPPGVSAWPCDGHILIHLQAQIHGPEETVYENGVFKLDIQVPERYPFEPPNIKFITPVYHPNIDNGGRICLDLLNLPPKGAWRPSLNICTLLASIGLLLAEPNPDDGLMGDITAEYKHDRLSFDVKARNWTELYASQDQAKPELKMSQTPANAEANPEVGTARLHGQEQMQASISLGEHMSLNCATSSQPLRPKLSFSKRLALDRGTACSQEAKAASSHDKFLHTDSVNCLVSSRKQSEETSLHTKADAQILKELEIQEKQTKGNLVFETLPSHTEEKSMPLCNHSGGDIFDEMAANSTIDAMLSHSTSMERFSEVGEAPQSDGSCKPSVPKFAKVFDAEKNDGRSMPTSGPKHKDSLSAEKENQPPKLCLAAKPKDGNFKHLAGDKGLLAEGRPMEASSNFKTLPCVNLVHDHGGKNRDSVCLPSRTKSLKLTRAKPDSNVLHATKGQQSIPADKQQTLLADKKWRSPVVIPDDAPIVVVSDSGSDSEPSDERSTLSLTQRDLNNKRKANFKLR